MLLAWIRYILICCRNSWFYNRISDDVTKKSFVAIIVVIVMPAILWTIMVYYGSPATGNLWYFRSVINSTEKEPITVFQSISEDERHKAKPIVIAMNIVILLQLFLTLFFYVKICYDSYMSTLRVNLKRDSHREENQDKDTPFQERKKVDTEIEEPQTRIFHPRKSETSTTIDKGMMIDKSNCDSSGIKQPLHSNHVMKKKDPDDIIEAPEKIAMFKNNKRRQSNRISTQATSFDVKSNKESGQKILNGTNRGTKTNIYKKKIFLPTSEDYAHIGQPGTFSVSIPLTKVVLCVSNKDLVCTASLTTQIICLVVTHVLMIYCFRIGGQEVTLSKYESVSVCIEIAVIINSFISSCVSLMFSSNFRDAVCKIFFPKQSSNVRGRRENK